MAKIADNPDEMSNIRCEANGSYERMGSSKSVYIQSFGMRF